MKLTSIAPFVMAAAVLMSGCAENTHQQQDPPQNVAVQPAQVPSVERETTLGPVHAVVRMTPENPVIGDPVTLSLEVDAEQDVRVDMPEFGDQLGRFNISDFKPAQKLLDSGRSFQSQTYTLDLPMSGKLRIPSFLVEFVDNRESAEPGTKGKVQELLTEELSFEVKSVLAQGAVSDELRPLRGEMDELVLPKDEEKRFPWLPVALGLLLLIGLGSALVVTRRKKKELVLPPHLVALNALDDLEKRGMPKDAEEVDGWYVELSRILRHYVEGRFSLHAPRLTTEEFFEVAKNSNALGNDEKSQICELLERSDRVKFANFVPGNKENLENLSETRAFIEKTRPKIETQGVNEESSQKLGA